MDSFAVGTKWQKLHGSTKSLDSDENFKPEHTLFCRELRFVAIYALFGDLWAKKVPFWAKNSVSWARSALLHGIYCIFYELKFAKNNAFVAKIVNTRLTKGLMAIFAPAESLPSPATLHGVSYLVWSV